MIFVSVGSMLPFDRLVQAADVWAAANPDEEVLIQIGRGEYEPRHASWMRIMPMAEYRERIRSCRLFVAHVGMGSILQGLEEQRQMLLLPRLRSLGEHTTDHQLHTAERFADTQGILIVDDVTALQMQMTRLHAAPLATGGGISPYASPALLGRVGDFINDAAGQPRDRID